jgi:hypothetical protein
LPQFKGALALFGVVSFVLTCMKCYSLLILFLFQLDPKLAPLVEKVEVLVESKLKVVYYIISCETYFQSLSSLLHRQFPLLSRPLQP